MTVTTETLLAYLDGELPAQEMKAVEAALAADPALRRTLETQRAVSMSLQSAFAPVIDEPVPSRLLGAVNAAKPAWTLRAIESIRAAFADRPLMSGSATAGIALAVGLIVGAVVEQPQDGAFSTGPKGLMARADLAQALDHQLASNQDPAAAQKVGLTFRNGDGSYCRSFAAPGTAGIACRELTGWHVVALAATGTAAAGPQYRTAAADMPDIIRDAASAMMAGPVLNGEAERRARDGGWAAAKQ